MLATAVCGIMDDFKVFITLLWNSPKFLDQLCITSTSLGRSIRTAHGKCLAQSDLLRHHLPAGKLLPSLMPCKKGTEVRSMVTTAGRGLCVARGMATNRRSLGQGGGMNCGRKKGFSGRRVWDLLPPRSLRKPAKRTGWNLAGEYMGTPCKTDSVLLLI